MDLKKPLTFDEQISKLKEHGLVIADTVSAKNILQTTNYYRISGYALSFRETLDQNKYIKGTEFEQIYQLYKFDENIRNLCRKYIEKAEIYYRTQISYGFAIRKCKQPPYDQHYDINNFYNKKGYTEIIENFKKEKNYYKDSLIVQHHKYKYSDRMPLWVIVELMSFSNMSKLYYSMYNSEKESIASSVGTSKDILANHLHCLSVLRNKCAHAARLYGTICNPPAKLSVNFLRKHPDIRNNSLFCYLLVLGKRLPNITDKTEYVHELGSILSQYISFIDLSLIGFPENYLEIMDKYIVGYGTN